MAMLGRMDDNMVHYNEARGVDAEQDWQGAESMSQTPGRIQKVDPLEGSIVYTVGVFEPRIGGSSFWILVGVWAHLVPKEAHNQKPSYMSWSTTPSAKPKVEALL